MKSLTTNYATMYLGDARDIVPSLEQEIHEVITDPPYGVGTAYNAFKDTPAYVRDVAVPIMETCINRYDIVVATVGIRTASLYPQPDDMGVWWCPAPSGFCAWGQQSIQALIYYYGKDPYGAKVHSSPVKGSLRTGEKVAHPCAKPLAFMKWLVGRASREKDVVLDPFMGSGTTGVACVALNRHFIGIERDPAYFKVACERLKEAERQYDLFYDMVI